MTDRKYSAEDLELLHKGFNQLFYILIQYSGTPSSHLKTRDVVRRLGSQEKDTWERIREVFDEEALFQAFDADTVDPIVVLVALFQSMDNIRSDLLSASGEFDSKEAKLLAEVEDLKDLLETTRSQLAGSQHNKRFTDAELATSKSNLEMYMRRVEEKDNKIQELQRSGNVTLWEKEKERVFEQHLRKEKELEAKIESLEIDHRMKCERFEQRIKDIQNKQKSEKLQNEVPTNGAPRTVNSEELDEMKRRVYYLGKDLLGAEKTMMKLQKEISGVLQGVERDFRIVHHKMVENKEVNMKLMDKIAGWMNKLHEAFKEGDMAPTLAILPDYYRAPDLKMKPISIRKLSAVKISNGKTNAKSKKNLEELVKGVEEDVWRIETDKAMRDQEDSNILKSQQKTDVVHPTLIYGNGKVNTTELIKHFPQLSASFVEQQYKNFLRYDRNGDRTLDLAEMMTAITATLGHRFTAQEVVEVMNEVDDDNSSSLDFYEYLKVSIIIVNKQGKSGLFKDVEVNKNKKELSKTCLIQ